MKIRLFEVPHFDDFPLTFGGLLLNLKKLNQLEYTCDVVCFSRSNYLCRDEEGNRDTSEKRVQYATGIRVIEEENCLKYLGVKHLILLGLNEALLRGYGLTGTKFEFPKRIDWNKDKHLVEYLTEIFKKHLQFADEVYFPLAIRGHVDHLIVREAGLKAVKELDSAGIRRASVFFGEDQPYAGTTDPEDWREVEEFIKENKLEAITYEMDLEEKLKLLEFYPSQTEPTYFEGVRKRALQLKKQISSEKPAERIYKYPEK